jgi:hypothetical protein
VEKEKRIVRKHLPDIEDRILDQLVRSVQHLRTLDLDKAPGVAETLDWASGLLALGAGTMDEQTVRDTLGLALKTKADVDRVRAGALDTILQGSGQ